MAKDAIVSDELAKKFATEKDTPYTRWVRDEGLDIISAHYVRNLRTVELKPWARRGGKGVFINHEASRTSNDCYVCEIAPGKKLEPRHHLQAQQPERLVVFYILRLGKQLSPHRIPVDVLDAERAILSPE